MRVGLEGGWVKHERRSSVSGYYWFGSAAAFFVTNENAYPKG
jgi:hypothetical protein